MTVLPQNLRDHLARDVTSVCFCWIVRCRDGVVLGFTDHDRALTVDGVACEPATGFVAGAIESGLGFAGDTAEVAGHCLRRRSPKPTSRPANMTARQWSNGWSTGPMRRKRGC